MFTQFLLHGGFTALADARIPHALYAAMAQSPSLGDAAAVGQYVVGRFFHHMINRADVTAVYLEVGSRQADDLTTCSDIDMMSANADGRFTRKDGSPIQGG